MRPEDETPRDDEAPRSDEAADTPDEPEAPPSTYAGRRRAEGAGEDAGPESPAESAGDAADTAEPGMTEEFDQIERELDAELSGLGDEHLAKEDDQPDESAPPEEPEAAESDRPESAEPEETEAAEPEETGESAEPEATGESEEPGETVAAQSVGVADRQAAEEAALAGLKARAGAGAAWEPAARDEPADTAPAAPEEEEETTRAKPIWARFLTASLVIIISVATATSISILVYLTDFAEGLRDNGKFARFSEQFAAVDGGDPQNILIIGSDERVGIPNDRRSDTAILLRIDPEQQAISLLSIPRDLKVTIPNHGPDKFNAAYSYGGAKLTLRTVKQLTGLDIHHLVNINFTGFADAVNAIDCVYIDVDRRYYIPEEHEIAEIDIEAGYQRMCGYKALQYVRFRHDDNDLVRSARQQDFLREARAQVPPWKLIQDRDELIEIFTDYTTSDIDDPLTLLELLKTLFAARNAELQEVHFPANLGEADSPYVTADSDALKKTIDTFMGTRGTPGPPDAGNSRRGDSDRNKDKPRGKTKDKPKEEDAPEGPPMEDSTEQGQQYAQQFSTEETGGGEPMIKFPIFYPTQLVPGSVITDASRAFPIDGPGDDRYWGYKMSIQVPGFTFGNGLQWEYYGISGTNWDDPPILWNPSETRGIDGRTYDLYYDGDRLRLVAWHDKRGNSYWINNTLSQSLSEAQMLQIAVSMRRDD